MGVEKAMSAHFNSGTNRNMGGDFGVIANDGAMVDDGKRSDIHSSTDFGRGVDDCCRVYPCESRRVIRR